MQKGKLNLNDLASLVSEKPRYLIDNFIPERSIGILVGEWGIGKSPLALQMLISMAVGKPFLNKYVINRTARCLYVDMENSAHAVFNVVNSLHSYLGVHESSSNLEVYSPNYTPKIEELKHYPEDRYIMELVKRDPIDFLIIDPLRIFKPEAESKNVEAAKMIHELRDLIAMAGSSILFIHHPRKIGSDPTIQRFKLDQNPTEWMANACGAAALVQNADFRIGFEEDHETGLLVLRRFVRSQGWFPAEYLDRDYNEQTDEPIGYVLKTGLGQLSAIERMWYNELPKEFSTKDLVFKSGKSRVAVTAHTKKWLAQGVIHKLDKGYWLKVQ